jgi:hypothetical protein
MLGSGKYSTRWGYFCGIGSIAKDYPSCRNYQQLNSRRSISPRFCRSCTNWEILDENNPLIGTVTPKTYATGILLPGKQNLLPLCYHMMF